MAKIKKKRGEKKKFIKNSKKAIKPINPTNLNKSKKIKKQQINFKKSEIDIKNIEISKGKAYVTDIDRFYEMIRQNKKIHLRKITIALDMPKKIAEEWSKILQEHGLIKIAYPVFGGPELIWKE